MSSVATQAANEEPWSQRHPAHIACSPGYGAAAVGPGYPALPGAHDRRIVRRSHSLLDDLVHLEERESRELSERLHDGALQYVLAARLDLDDVRGSGNEEAVDRIERALAESTRMLRSTVSEFNPAVLEARWPGTCGPGPRHRPGAQRPDRDRRR